MTHPTKHPRRLAALGLGACLSLLCGLTITPAHAQSSGDTTRLSAAALASEYAGAWSELEPGLELRAFQAPQASPHGDQMIVALRIDPERFAFRLLIADELDESRMSAARWAERYDLVAATNAGMFAADAAARPVAFTRADGRTVNPTVRRDNTLFAFAGQQAETPDVRIIDRECDNLDALMPDYPNLLQSIRMISCDGRNVWTQQDRIWSTAALATDSQGRILFVHVRSPYSVHDLIAMLQALPLDIERAMYLEGGPEATVYARTSDVELERYGSFETGFFESDGNGYAWSLPNIIGVVRRADSDEATP